MYNGVLYITATYRSEALQPLPANKPRPPFVGTIKATKSISWGRYFFTSGIGPGVGEGRGRLLSSTISAN